MAIAGNPQKAIFRFDKLATEAGTVQPSTAWMAVTHPDGTVEALACEVTYDNDDAVIVTGTWSPADNADGGVYWITADVTGNMEAAHQHPITLEARHAPAAP